jgi:hypothetical protein
MTTPLVPIFIIVHDRVEVLKKTVESLKQIQTPIEIIFHDVASTFPGCIEYLNEQREKGQRVYRSEKNHHHTVLSTVKKYLAEHSECQYYVITDPDIELDHVPGDILEFYIHLSKKYGHKYVVGPMLRIDDIPAYYPKKALAVRLHKAQFWNKKRIPIKWKNKTAAIQFSPIDTTFQVVHRSGKALFPRPGIRCYAPYAARHLDWYINPKQLTPDQEYYSAQATRIAHWGRNVSKATF